MKTMLYITAALAAWLTAHPAAAEGNCALRDDAVPLLNEKYKETIVGRGLVNQGQFMVEVFVSEEGSWTVLMSDPQGTSCIVAAGEDWHEVQAALGDPT